ncbi:hypothetical protein AB8A28_13965 [Tardiphaga sp. 71_E8_N1_1]|uniref:hypothetical protein n=1 Tax=Tardiphaga sp. 71_E8_N1_1 TaxID=3240784 RepID=UPI003F8A5EEA
MHGVIASSEVQRLRDRIEELETLLGAGPDVCDRLQTLGLPLHSRKFLGVVLKRSVVSRNAAYIVMYGDRPEASQPEMRTLDVHVWFVRGRLRGRGIELKTQRGFGWYLTPEDKAKINAMIGAVPA